ncbi:hypothetical protein N7478_013283 [Penicillium angulare]|uniref:uncharacterized protein n=1 Tax=Penicillium angulare TaxID=116970 RepID=UPI00253F6660|nr:uncharacterized protein N7478_013283 [Penicillium angulare]KAJ5257179.1 hypothetical protein N7478_013283 [Penicillium angulare]
MAAGGCFCGNIRIEYNGKSVMAGICHCQDCRKLTGSIFSYSFAINSADLKVTGTPKGVPKTADSGNAIKNYFCPDCGTPLFGRRVKGDEPDGDTIILRAGIFDNPELLNTQKPGAELYTENRLDWLAPIEGAAQITGMMELP